MRIAAILGLPDLLAGALFVVHPFAVNTVGYIAARASIVSTLCGLAGVWAILAGYSWWSLLFLVLAMFAKEDGIAFAMLFVALGAWWNLPLMAVVAWGKRGQILEFQKNNGDEIMARIGLPVSHPQPAHAWTVFVETVMRLGGWIIGAGRSPYHGSGIARPSWKCRALSLLTLSLWIVVALAVPVPIAILLFGPWLVYLLIPVPDQLMEYRNYSMTAGFALLLAMLPLYIACPLLLLFAVYSHREATCWSDAKLLWERAMRSTSGDRSRAPQEIGAILKLRGQDAEAEPYLQLAVNWNSRLAPAVNNLAWIWIARGDTRGLKLMESCVTEMPEYPMGVTELASMKNQLGLQAFRTMSYAIAKHWFSRALDVRRDFMPYIYNRAVAMKVLGENAEPEFQRLPRQMEGTREMIHPAEVPR